MITKAAFLLFRSNNNNEKEILFVRPYGKDFYILPGGKQEEGETIEEALVREMQEELQVDVSGVEEVGVVDGATPDGRSLCIRLFTGSIQGELIPSAEIKEVAWLGKTDTINMQQTMTPMSIDHLLPYLSDNKFW